jgi:predicted RND superfamily exporter protein
MQKTDASSEWQALPACLPRAVMDALAGVLAARPRTVLAVTAVLLILSGWRISKLRLDTDFAQLLPRSAPAVSALDELNRRIASLSSLDVVVEGPDAAANRRYIDALVPRLRELGDPLIDDVRAGVDEEQAFFERNKLLYASAAELERAREHLAQEIAQHKNPLYVSLEDDDSDKARAASPFARFPDGHFAYADGTLYTALIWLRSPLVGAASGAATVARIRATARAVAAALPPAPQRIGLTGNLITADEERAALTGDLTLASGISVALVCVVVLLYFRRVGALVLMVVPALIAVTMALACAQLFFGALNTATGFLGAIILGNGINYAIVQMARYEEERRRGATVDAAMRIAIASTWRGTRLAALAAALAYGSLALTDFRGFNQFGYIGGLGMVLAWLATLLVLPALWVLCDRRGTGAARPGPAGGFAWLAPLGRFIVARPRTVLGAGIALTLIALPPLLRVARDPFEYDFDKLRNQAAKRSDAERLSQKIDPIFGRSLSPGFVLADDARQIDAIARQLRERDRVYHVLGAIKTVNDYLPGSPAEQSHKLALIARIRRLIDDNIGLLEGDERARFASLRPPDDLRVLLPRDLPRSVRRFYTEADGTIGRVAAWFPREDLDIWNGHVLDRIAATVADLTLDDGTRVRSSGRAVVFAAIIAAVVHDGPIITAASFTAVLILVVAVARRRGAWLIVGSLVVGVVWMMGAVAVAGVRINFLNFIALPITFGIATDYSANLYLRYEQEGRARLPHVIAATGGAVALCSLTTIIGYGALLLADTQGLRSFGAAAILGEIACLTTALALVPAVLALVDGRSR